MIYDNLEIFFNAIVYPTTEYIQAALFVNVGIFMVSMFAYLLEIPCIIDWISAVVSLTITSGLYLIILYGKSIMKKIKEVNKRGIHK